MDKLKTLTQQDDSFIEAFPVKKTQIRFSAPPDMIFFEAEEATPDEADFIRLDDLFRIEGVENPLTPVAAELREVPEQQVQPQEQLSGAVSFTLIPRYRYQYIDASMARLIRRALIICARKEKKRLELIRVRPLFVQWTMKIEADDDAYQLMKYFRDGLDQQIMAYTYKNKSRNSCCQYWADDCLILSAEKNLSDGRLIRFVNRYQLQQD